MVKFWVFYILKFIRQRTIYVQKTNNKGILLILKKFNKCLKKWQVVNLANVFVIREMFLKKYGDEKQEKE